MIFIEIKVINLRIYYCKIKQNNKKNIKPTINKKSKQLATIHDKKVEKKLNNYFTIIKVIIMNIILNRTIKLKLLLKIKVIFPIK